MFEAVNLSAQEFKQLVEIISILPDLGLGDAASRSSFLHTIGLDRFARRIKLTSAPESFSRVLVSQLVASGSLPDDLRFHALGKFLLGIEDELTAEQQAFVKSLVCGHGLLNDEEYVRKLESEIAGMNSIISETNRPCPSFRWAGPASNEAFERIIGTPNFLPSSFLSTGAECSQSVAVIQARAPGGAFRNVGTGFLVSHDLLLTNNHVIPDQSAAENMRVMFNYEADATGELSPKSRVYRFRSNDAGVFMSSQDTDLDFTLIELSCDSPESAPGRFYRSLRHRLSNSLPREGDRVYIIQHPSGRPKEIVIDNNAVCAVDENCNRIQYLANTEPGSSGSPVFDDRWQVVALHHSGSPHGAISNWLAERHFHGNEGILFAGILRKIENVIASRHDSE